MRQPSLLARVGAMLTCVAALPLVISFYQLRSNRDALLDQVQRTQIVAAAAAADGIAAHLAVLRSALGAVAADPRLPLDAGSAADPQALGEILGAILEARPEVAALGLEDDAGRLVVRAQRGDLRAELEALAAPEGAPGGGDLELLDGGGRPWLRLRRPLAGALGRAVLFADGSPLLDALARPELGEAARLGLFGPGKRLLGELPLAELPPTLADGLATGHLGSGGLRVRGSRGDDGSHDRIVAYARVPESSWVAVAEQPASVAEVAQRRIRAATWLATLASAGLVAALLGTAWTTVVRPLRRLVAAQQGLAGFAAEPAGGDEVAALERAFGLLEQRVRDGEDLSRVFLGRYQVRRLLGSGGMGTVFEGWDPSLRRRVALKTLRPREGSFDWPGLADRLLEEASTNARFIHPHIVTVFDVARTEAAAFIAMEMVDGIDLDVLLRAGGALPPDQAVALGLAIARALAVAHAQGLVHQDIKPSNVLLGRDGSIKVTDFGVSRLLHAANTEEGVICGTPGYIAPESLLGEPPSPSNDVFALGVLLYESLTGRHPFRSSTVPRTISQTLWNEAMPLERVVSGLPRELQSLVERLLAKEPATRGDAAGLVAELEALARSGPGWQTVGVIEAADRQQRGGRPARARTTLLHPLPARASPSR